MAQLLTPRPGGRPRPERFLAEFRSLDLERALQRMNSEELEAIREALRFLLDDVIPVWQGGGGTSEPEPGSFEAEAAALEYAFLEHEVEVLGRELLDWFAAPGAPEPVRDARRQSVLRSVHRIEAVLELRAASFADEEAN
jgi:hypothetical protein